MGGVHRGAEITMEYLETKSVPVIGYKTNEMPAYMAITSGIKLPCKMDSVEEVAKSYQIKNELNIQGGIILMNPICEEYAVDADKMNAAIEKAIEQSKNDNVSGKAITGYLMKYMKEKLGADSMDAQKIMLVDNAVLAAKLANSIRRK